VHSGRSFLRAVATIGLTGATLSLVELAVRSQVTSGWQIAYAKYALYLAASLIVLLLLHLGPAWAVLARLRRRRTVLVAVSLLTVLYALSWQHAIMAGGALWLRPWFPVIQVVCALLVPLAIFAFVWLVFLSDRVPLRVRRSIALVTIFCAVGFDLLLVRPYEAFHGHLALANAATLAWLLFPLSRFRSAQYAGVAIATVASAAFFGCPGRGLVAEYVARFSRMPRTIGRMSPARALLPSSPNDPAWSVACNVCSDASLPADKPADGKRFPRGRNVILIVLESTRWDVWSDPVVTPRFHSWSQRGAYAARGAAAYSATLFSYGSIFTSLPASVVTHTERWRDHKLFDLLRPHFEHLLLTKPDIALFRAAATEFFMEPQTPIHEHASAEDALSYLEHEITNVREHESFFAWAHLYEPHAPYVQHDGFRFGDSRVARYRSEVAYVDDRLGDFIDWFMARPESKDTLLVVMADHGESLGDVVGSDALWGHGYSTRAVETDIPMFFTGPGIPAGIALADGSISHLDFMPSVFDFLGMTIPSEYGAQGRSIYELVGHAPDRSLVSERWDLNAAEPMFALRRGPYRLVADPTLEMFSVYDTRHDPYESVDVSRANGSTLAELEKELRTWLSMQRALIRKLGPGS
jgi:hypothetical protein